MTASSDHPKPLANIHNPILCVCELKINACHTPTIIYEAAQEMAEKLNDSKFVSGGTAKRVREVYGYKIYPVFIIERGSFYKFNRARCRCQLPKSTVCCGGTTGDSRFIDRIIS